MQWAHRLRVTATWRALCWAAASRVVAHVETPQCPVGLERPARPGGVSALRLVARSTSAWCCTFAIRRRAPAGRGLFRGREAETGRSFFCDRLAPLAARPGREDATDSPRESTTSCWKTHRPILAARSASSESPRGRKADDRRREARCGYEIRDTRYGIREAGGERREARGESEI